MSKFKLGPSEKIERHRKRKEMVAEEPEESLLKKKKFGTRSDATRLVDPQDIFARVVGEELDAFQVPQPRTVERFEAALGINPISNIPLNVRPIEATPRDSPVFTTANRP